jgi:hypothetical protein
MITAFIRYFDSLLCLLCALLFYTLIDCSPCFSFSKYCRAFEGNVFRRIFVTLRTSNELRKLGNKKLRNFHSL